MPRLIVIGGTANALSHTLTGSERLHVEAISADIDTAGAGGDSAIDAVFTDQSGLLIGRSRSSTTFPAGQVMELTFAPDLPDTAEVGNTGLGQKQTTGLIDTVLPPQSKITVQGVDPGVLITQLRIWAENVDDSETAIAGELAGVGRWAYVPGPGA